MELQVPGQKIKPIRAEARNLLQTNSISAREITRLIGKMTVVTQAIPPAPFFYRNLQRDVSWTLARSDQNYDALCRISPDRPVNRMEWEESHERTESRYHDRIGCIPHMMGNNLERSEHGRTVECSGKSMAHKLLRDSNSQPSSSDLLKESVQYNCPVTVGQHDSSVVHKSPRGDCVPSGNPMVKDLWIWCLRQSISLKAQHLPGNENVIADQESRVMRDRSDWLLNPATFNLIKRVGVMEIDLFASRLTTQFPQFFSWRPDPVAMATDALVQDWSDMKAYANPPWNLIGRVLAKIQEHKNIQMILMTPLWPAQSSTAWTS